MSDGNRVFGFHVTRTTGFGVSAKNELEAQAIAKKALALLESEGELEWMEDIEFDGEVPEETIVSD